MTYKSIEGFGRVCRTGILSDAAPKGNCVKISQVKGPELDEYSGKQLAAKK